MTDASEGDLDRMERAIFEADWREEWDAITLDQRMTKYHDAQAEVH